MKLVLHFYRECIGQIVIHTHSGHGNFEVVFVNGKDVSDDGDVIDMLRDAITHDQLLFAMYEAQYESNGVYREKEAS